MKKLFSLSLVALAAAVVFSACTKKGGEEEGPETIEYTVTFDSKDGSNVEPVKVKAGSLVTKPADPTKADHTFAGWFKETGTTNQWNFTSDKVKGDITLYAKWIAGDDVVKVTFNANGGSPVPPVQIFEKGGKATRPTESMTKDLHTFDDWYGDKYLTEKYNFDAEVNADITIYANWTPTVTMAELNALIAEAVLLEDKEDDYTTSSFNKFIEELNDAKAVADNQSATAQDIFDAYIALKLAKENLKAAGAGDSEVASIDMSSGTELEGAIWVLAGEYIYLEFYCLAADGSELDYEYVDFSYDLAAWVDNVGDINEGNHSLQFTVKEGLAENSTTNIVVSSKSKPEVKKTVTFKVVSYQTVVNKFTEIMNGLDPEDIDYDDYAALDTAGRLYEYYLDEDGTLDALAEKLQECWDAYMELPVIIDYKATGGKYTLTISMDGEEDVLPGLTYVKDGEFPFGMYTSSIWEFEGTEYGQYRFSIAKDNKFFTGNRYSYNPDGSNSGDWEDWEAGEYIKFEGTETSGQLYIKMFYYVDEPEQPIEQPGNQGGKRLQRGLKMLQVR